MRFSIIIFFVFIIGGSVRSQNQQNSTLAKDSFESLWKSGSNTVLVYNNSYEGVEGSPFLFDFWALGEITLTSSIHFDSLRIKYNIVDDNIFVQNDLGKIIIPVKSLVQSFIIIDSLGNDYKFIKMPLISEKENAITKHGFFELLFDGKVKLLAQRKKYLKEADYQGAYSANRPYDEFRSQPPIYYWVNTSGVAVKLKKGKKGVLARLENNEVLANYVKKEHLDLKKEHDLIILISYLNDLMK